MKSIKIAAFAVLAAVLLVGCGEQSVSETSGSSVESTTSSSPSVESSSEPSSTSGGQSSSSSEVADNQDILTSNQSSQGDSSTSSDTSTDVSTSEPTPDTHEPTSEPTASSSGSTGETSKPNTSKPTSSSSQPTTSKPTGETSKPTTSTSTPTSPYWNPNAPGNKPGPYGGYYDANGALHAIKKNVPKDSDGYSVISYTDEYGVGHMTKAEKEAARAEEERIANGGGRGAGEAEITEEGLASWGW